MNFRRTALFLFIVAGTIFLSSCSGISPEKIKLVVIETSWTALRAANGFGTISLHIKGTTNADRVTIETYGDGVISSSELKVSQHSFDESVIISFTRSPGSTPKKYSTKLTVFKNSESKHLTITSEDLIFQ